MEIKVVTVGAMQSNCYIVSNEGSCILIDAGGEPKKIEREIGENKLKAVLLTHGHFDHIGACKYFRDLGAEIYIGEKDSEMTYTDKNLGESIGIKVPKFNADNLVRGGDKIELIGLKIKVLATPGHTEGGMCYVIGDCIFTGDTLFRGGIGRWDFPGGSYMLLINSIGENLLTLENDYKLYPGHGDSTTLLYEKSNNPYLG